MEMINLLQVTIKFRKFKAQQAIFAHELRSALRLTVGLSDIYCDV